MPGNAVYMRSRPSVGTGDGERGSAWGAWPLHLKFAAASSVVLLIGMMIVGWWVSSKIRDAVTRNSAISTALYMESFIAPISQELSSRDTVTPETSRELWARFREPHLAERIASIKLWKEGGVIAFSTDPRLIGERFDQSETQRAAWRGEVSASFDDLNDREDAGERLQNLPLLEVYSPIRSIFDGEIIAVAEFYQIATELEGDLFDARFRSWLVVAGVSAMMFALLFGIVYRGSQLIERQRLALERRFEQLALVSRQNYALRWRIQAASARGSELNERYLRRISAELHDGPAQSVAFASLRVNSLAGGGGGEAGEEVARVKAALDEAMTDIRNICRGLSLPELESSSLGEAVTTAVRAHERRVETRIDLALDGEPDHEFDHPARICAFRFVQETLNNATSHAGGEGMRVRCAFDGGRVSIEVGDAGPGFAADSAAQTSGLGLRGLRERIESHGGSFAVESAPGRGTTVRMTIDAKENTDAT